MNILDTPLEILEKRYARGEIDEEEFVRRKNGLGGQLDTAPPGRHFTS